MRTLSRQMPIVVVLAVVAGAAALAEEGVVSGYATGPDAGQLGGYASHENHPIRSRGVTFENGRCRTAFITWVDVDPSHAPLVLPLEGMIGFPSPAGGNWYSNGFLDLFVGEQIVGTVEPKSVRVMETGKRGRARFVWERPEGTWSVIFVVLPGDEKVFCAARFWPKDPAMPLSLRLTCYPGGQTHDGNRAVTTAEGTTDQVETVEMEPARCWWYALYDTVHDYGGGSDGGAAVLFDPDYLSKVGLVVESYPVMLRPMPAPGKCEVRMILWDNFFGKRNAEIVEYLKANADALLKELRSVSFDDPRALSGGEDQEAQQVEALLAKMPNCTAERQRATELAATLTDLRGRLTRTPQGIPPDDEDGIAAALEARRRLLWDLKWRELLEAPQ